MRLTLFLLVISVFSAYSNSYAQKSKLNINVQNKSLKYVLNEIETRSDFFFMYNNKQIDVERKIDLNANSLTIDAVLKKCFEGTAVNYKIVNKQILLFPGNLIPLLEIQKKMVTGNVSDKYGTPIPGATVSIKGTTVGAITDRNGNFSFELPAEAKTIVFSFIGMKTQEIAINGKTSFSIVMEEETIGLKEVVVVGYGTQRKANLTGSVSSVNFETPTIAARPLTNVSTALSGMSAGMFIRQGDGTPSSDGATIKIRGIGSLNSSQNPLVIVDGQPSDINIINPNDVASISILKDAASSAIYGSRASNGVILITTKAGNNKGKISFNYTANTGFAEPTKLIDFVSNTADHMSLINQIQANSGLPAAFTQSVIDTWREKSKTDVLYPNTNWWDAIIKPNVIQDHNFSARGGNDKVSFYSSIGYLDNNGIINNTGYKKFNFRNNLTYKVNDWLTLGNNITALYGKAKPASADAIFQWFEATTPGLLPKYNGQYGASMTGSESSANNPVATLENALGEKSTQEYTGKLFATLTPIQGLEITGSYFMDIYNYNDWSSTYPIDTWNFQDGTIVSSAITNIPISNSYSKWNREVYDAYASYAKSFGKHNAKILLGYNQEYYKQDAFSTSKIGLMSTDIPVLNAASTLVSSSGNSTDYAMQSYFGPVKL